MTTSDPKTSTFTMPDRRLLHLYGSFSGRPEWPDEEHAHEKTYSHRRWHPMRREWVVYSAHRQTRTYKPATTACPLCPMAPDGEIPVDDFEIAVFDNRFSSLQKDCPKPTFTAGPGVAVDSAAGNCEVIVYSSDHKATMATLSQDRRELLVKVWAERVKALMQLPEVQCVYPFENRGEEAGVTLHHPHGQIYAFSYLPPVIETMAKSFAEGYDLAKLAASPPHEVAQTESMTALVPPFARFPYEVWIVPKIFRSSPADLSANEVRDCASLLACVAKKYDTFFGRICPYIMAVYVAPRGAERFFPFHIQFYPLLRAPQKLKFVAGVELGTGSFLVDIMPEAAAQSLRQVKTEDLS